MSLHSHSPGGTAPRLMRGGSAGATKPAARRLGSTAALVSRRALQWAPAPLHRLARGGRPVASASALPSEVDVVVIGSGFGGLSCGALLARYGYSVAVCESHTAPGGVAHAFERTTDRGTYKFDSGPSFYCGLSSPKGQSTSALKQVLDIIGEDVDVATYNQWQCYFPEGPFTCRAEPEFYREQLARYCSPEGMQQWAELERRMRPLSKFTAAAPFAAMRSDAGMALTMARYGGGLWESGLIQSAGLGALSLLEGPFSDLVDEIVTDPFLKKMIDLECFVITGQLAGGSPTPEMTFMYEERHKEGAILDYPVGGAEALINALVRGLEKHGGSLHLGQHVEEVMVEGGRAAGVRLRGGAAIKAREAVVTNASIWDTTRMLPPGCVPPSWLEGCVKTPETGSFMHLHLGIDAEGLPSGAELGIHHLVVNDWELGVGAPSNVINISIPSALDPGLAPPGCHNIHVYTAGNEPWDLWENMKRGSPEYLALKEERVQCCWQAIEKVIPDVRARAEVALVGTPLTHKRFNRRHNGTYGPRICGGMNVWPGPETPLPGLLACGDSTFPGIGVPAAAGSGMIAANSLVSPLVHLKTLDAMSQSE